jgi:hypothetical protein
LGTTEANLATQIAGVSTDLQTKYDALTAGQKALATQLTNQGIDLNTAITRAKAELTTEIETKNQAILDRAAEYEQAGIARDKALELAQQELTQTVGRGTQQATQTDLDNLISLLRTNGAYDPQYDYNNDGTLDDKDRSELELGLQDPTKFVPVGGKWAPTGVFKTVADEAAATRQAQAAEAERTRQAAARNAANQAKLGNINTLTQMLGQAEDTKGQQVTVKQADPAKIGYVYDFNSIFANPSQEKMFVSPYAEGGLVDGSEDVNEELLKLLKG